MVFLPGVSEFVIYCSLLVMTKDSNGNIYCAIKVKIFRYLNQLLCYGATRYEGLANKIIMLQFKNV
jgi:hypothetical protein